MRLFKESIEDTSQKAPEYSERPLNHWFGLDMVNNGDWQKRLIPALEEHNYLKFKQLRETYLNQYPEEQEMIEVFFDTLSSLSAQKQLRKDKTLNREQRREKIKQLTEYEYLLTHFLVNNQNKLILKNFWQRLEQIATIAKKEYEFKSMKQGVLGQVAIFLSLDRLGLDPQLAHPRLDMYDKIDLQIPESTNQGREVEVQIKSSQKLSSPELFSSANVYPVSIETHNQDGYQDITEQRFAQENKAFQIAVDRYKQQKHKNVKAYLIATPFSEIDHDTGEPSEKLIQFLENKFKIFK